MTRALTWEAMSPELLKVVDRAKRDPEGRFHALAYLMDVPALERAYHRQRWDAAVGVSSYLCLRHQNDRKPEILPSSG